LAELLKAAVLKTVPGSQPGEGSNPSPAAFLTIDFAAIRADSLFYGSWICDSAEAEL
jgi:hypothetical protein